MIVILLPPKRSCISMISLFKSEAHTCKQLHRTQNLTAANRIDHSIVTVCAIARRSISTHSHHNGFVLMPSVLNNKPILMNRPASNNLH